MMVKTPEEKSFAELLKENWARKEDGIRAEVSLALSRGGLPPVEIPKKGDGDHVFIECLQQLSKVGDAELGSGLLQLFGIGMKEEPAGPSVFQKELEAAASRVFNPLQQEALAAAIRILPEKADVVLAFSLNAIEVSFSVKILGVIGDFKITSCRTRLLIILMQYVESRFKTSPTRLSAVIAALGGVCVPGDEEAVNILLECFDSGVNEEICEGIKALGKIGGHSARVRLEGFLHYVDIETDWRDPNIVEDLGERIRTEAQTALRLLAARQGSLFKRKLNSLNFGKLPPMRRVLFLFLLILGGLPFIIKWDNEKEKRKKMDEGKTQD